MKIVVLANEEQKKELVIKPGTEEIHWLNDPAKAGDNIDACIDLQFDNSAGRIQQLKQLKAPLVIINSVIEPLNESTAGFVRINGWPTFLERGLAEAAGPPALREQAGDIMGCFDKTIEWVDDRPGLVSARIIAGIINEAYFALEEGVSTREEMDVAMKLGTNYPFGPFEWSKKIGLKNIYALLAHLALTEKRYEPSALLKNEALQ